MCGGGREKCLLVAVDFQHHLEPFQPSPLRKILTQFPISFLFICILQAPDTHIHLYL